MADALDSKSSMGNHVWVQLPPPVLVRRCCTRSSSDAFSVGGSGTFASHFGFHNISQDWVSRLGISAAFSQSLASTAARSWLSISDRAS
jgi:hypothetical protein